MMLLFCLSIKTVLCCANKNAIAVKFGFHRHVGREDQTFRQLAGAILLVEIGEDGILHHFTTLRQEQRGSLQHIERRAACGPVELIATEGQLQGKSVHLP